MMKPLLISTLVVCALSAQSPSQPSQEAMQRLVSAYPDHLRSVGDNAILWKDGTRMVFDHGLRIEDPEQRLDQACLRDQMLEPYPKGNAGLPPVTDPGRARYEPFFFKMYGANRQDVEKNLVSVRWLPRTVNLELKITRINGVDQKLKAVSDELETLPAPLRTYFAKPAGTFNWRPIAGTRRMSTHSFGIAIDLDTAHSDYWQWAKGQGNPLPAYCNRIPLEIVKVFEKHGFIWGGKWSHFDTMHFEYRPELLFP